jgi:hypothetical protein
LKPQLLSGARGEVRANGKVLAYVTDISVEAPQSVRGVHTFGAINARSVEPLMAGPCSVSIGRVIPMNKADGTPIDASMISEGIEPTLQQMLIAEDITIDLIDKVTGKTFASVRNCRFAGRSLGLSASQLANERVHLMGIYDSGRDGQNTPNQLGF